MPGGLPACCKQDMAVGGDPGLGRYCCIGLCAGSGCHSIVLQYLLIIMLVCLLSYGPALDCQRFFEWLPLRLLHFPLRAHPVLHQYH